MFCLDKFYPKHACKLDGDRVLQREEIGDLPIKTVGPEMPAGFSVNELRIHAHALSRLADAPFEHIAHAELAPDPLHVYWLALESEGGVARDHERLRQPRQLGGQIFCQAIDEIVFLGTPSEIGERQDYERQLRYADRADRQIGACPRPGTPYRVGPHRPRDVL
jgi:hypothetical protein